MNNQNSTLTNGQLDAQKRMQKKKRKKLIKVIVIVLIVVLVLLFALLRFGIVGKNTSVSDSTLTTYKVSSRTITDVLTSSGTIEPNDQYTINALVSGEIIADYFEEGDTVVEDQLLYEIDSEKLNSGVTRAENSLKNANKSLDKALENLEKLNIESNVTGTIKKLHVEVGDEINAGTLIADIIDNETMCIDVPFMDADCHDISIGDIATLTFDTFEETTGIVKEISAITSVNSLGVKIRNVTISVSNKGSITTSTKAFARVGDKYCTADGVFYNNDEGQIYSKIAGEVSKIYYQEGSRIYDGNIIARLESEDLEEQIEKLRDTVKESEESLEDATDAYDNYNIQAPITGKVISKSYKEGDTLSGGQGNSGTLAVIYDMSALKFTMSIDELDIDKVDKGQDVIVTCESREGVEYHGTITNISIQGTTTSGTTVYPVEVTIENVEDYDKRTVSEDGTINKVYKTGMTSTEKEYILKSTQNTPDGTIYAYDGGMEILFDNNGGVSYGNKQLNHYIANSYSHGSEFYYFADDMSLLTVEVENDKKMLRPGMNIDAKILVENRENVISIPLAAVGRGNIVKVLKSKDTENEMESSKSDNDHMGENKNNTFGKNPAANGYGTADIDSEYEEVRVTVGISDDDFVEITSGLKAGDIVIVDAANFGSSSTDMGYGMMGGGMMGGGMPSGGMMGGSRPGGMGGMSGGPMGR